MKKILLLCNLAFAIGLGSAQAQNLYAVSDTNWVNLDDFSKATPPDTSGAISADAVTEQTSSDFKKAGKYAARFKVVNLNGAVSTSTVYKERPFRILDDCHIGYKITPGSREIKVETCKEEEKLDDVAGNNFIVGTSEGVVHVTRMASEYRIVKHDEWGKVKYRVNLPHTNVVERSGEEYKQPTFCILHIPTGLWCSIRLCRAIIHKARLIDLKDGKTTEVPASVCGVVRADNEISYDGYIIRDEAAKTVKVNMRKGTWAIKDANAPKLQAESIINDSVFIMARYYKGTAGISLAAFGAKSGKVLWVGEVKQASTPSDLIYLSIYKNKLLMECAQKGGNYLEAFDIATGKRLYSSL